MTKFFVSIFLIFCASLASMTLSAQESCDHDKNKNILGLQDVVHHSLLSQPECKELKNIWEERVEIADSISKSDKKRSKFSVKYEKSFTECQSHLYKNCYKDLQPIDENIINSKFTEFKKDNFLRMPEPAGQCLQRAHILAEKLTSQGYKVEIARFMSPTIVGLVKSKDNKVIGFNEYSPALENGHHYVVSIDVKLSSGSVEKRILDPQYANEPMSVEAYSKRLTGDQCLEKLNREQGCSVEFKTPVTFNYEKHDYENFLNGNLHLVNACGWNMLEKAKEDIYALNLRAEAEWTTKSMKSSTLDLSEEEMLKVLQRKNLEDKIQMYQDAVSTLEKIVNSNKGNQSIKATEDAIAKARKKIQELQREINIREN